MIKVKKDKCIVWFGDKDGELVDVSYDQGGDKDVHRYREGVKESFKNLKGIEDIYEVDFKRLTIQKI